MFRTRRNKKFNQRKANEMASKNITEVLSAEIIKQAKGVQAGDVLNKVLYRLAKQYPGHRDGEQIYAKVVIIGKTYSAALERNKTHDRKKSSLYWDHVIPSMQKKGIDAQLDSVRHYQRITEENLPEMLRVHKKLMDAVGEATGQADRSFASKYLHFHLPKLFFLYDTYAQQAVNTLVGYQRKYTVPNTDEEYAAYSWKCMLLRDAIKAQFKTTLSPRQLDNLLMRKRRGLA